MLWGEASSVKQSGRNSWSKETLGPSTLSLPTHNPSCWLSDVWIVQRGSYVMGPEETSEAADPGPDSSTGIRKRCQNPSESRSVVRNVSSNSCGSIWETILPCPEIPRKFAIFTRYCVPWTFRTAMVEQSLKSASLVPTRINPNAPSCTESAAWPDST